MNVTCEDYMSVRIDYSAEIDYSPHFTAEGIYLIDKLICLLKIKPVCSYVRVIPSFCKNINCIKS